MAVDPVKGTVADPQTMVQYTYVLNNPLRYVDPAGLSSNEVGLRDYATNSGAEVGWDDKTRLASVTKDGETRYYSVDDYTNKDGRIQIDEKELDWLDKKPPEDVGLSDEETAILDDYTSEVSEYLDSWSDSDWSYWSESSGGDYAAMIQIILDASVAGNLHAKRDAIDALARQMVLDNAREIVDGFRSEYYTFEDNEIPLADIHIPSKPGDKFDSADDAAEAFAKMYNEQSIKDKREYGAVIYEVYEYEVIETRIKRKLFWIIPLPDKVIEETKYIGSYYTYSEPKKGPVIGPNNHFEAGVNTSEPPRNTTEQEYYEVAQIHTHGPYVNVNYVDGKNVVNHQGALGFSGADIEAARKRDVDTYMVDYYGNMYKATVAKNYKDGADVYMTGFYKDPRIEIQNGYRLDLVNNPKLWEEEYWTD